MLLDENILTIIGLSYRWSALEIDGFIHEHYTAMQEILLFKFSVYVEENLPEQKKEIEEKLSIKDGKFVPPKDLEKATNLPMTFMEQLNLILLSYPDLTQEIEDALYRFQRDMFVHYMQEGPTDGRLLVIESLKNKIAQLDEYPGMMETAKRLSKDKKVREVLE